MSDKKGAAGKKKAKGKKKATEQEPLVSIPDLGDVGGKN